MSEQIQKIGKEMNNAMVKISNLEELLKKAMKNLKISVKYGVVAIWKKKEYIKKRCSPKEFSLMLKITFIEPEMQINLSKQQLYYQ